MNRMLALHTFRLQAALLLVLVLSGCGVLSGADQQGTLSAELTDLVDEATAIASTYSVQSTQAAATAAWAATTVFQLDGINQQLAATMRAAIPPTQQVVMDVGPVTPGLNAPLPGEWTPTPFGGTPAATPPPGATTAPESPNQLTAVGPALAVRDEDGCAAGLQTSVSSSSTRIYATTRILNATAGTSIQAEWLFGGAVVYSNSAYTLPEDDSDFCVWFYIEPVDVAFTPGDWSLQFLVNGMPAGAAAAFTVTG